MSAGGEHVGLWQREFGEPIEGAGEASDGTSQMKLVWSLGD